MWKGAGWLLVELKYRTSTVDKLCIWLVTVTDWFPWTSSTILQVSGLKKMSSVITVTGYFYMQSLLWCAALHHGEWCQGLWGGGVGQAPWSACQEHEVHRWTDDPQRWAAQRLCRHCCQTCAAPSGYVLLCLHTYFTFGCQGPHLSAAEPPPPPHPLFFFRHFKKYCKSEGGNLYGNTKM